MAKNDEIRVKCSPEELDKIERKAKSLGIPPATLLRMLGLSANIELKAAIFS